MTLEVCEDIRDVALDFKRIYNDAPESYYYLKGFIHCLLQSKTSLAPFGKQGAVLTTAQLDGALPHTP